MSQAAQAAEALDAAAARKSAQLLHPARAVDRAIARMAKEVTAAIATANPVLLPVMHGGVFTASALAARCHFPYEFDYVHVTRYANRLAGGELEWRVRPSPRLAGRTVLVVDDILDRGVTLAALQEELRVIGVARQLSAVLVVKRLNEQVARPTAKDGGSAARRRSSARSTAEDGGSAAHRESSVRPAVDFVGFEVGDVYVFGCGMDYKGYWRGLRGLYALHERD
jgi:hypoxanthine phosphoribosyltransferase